MLTKAPELGLEALDAPGDDGRVLPSSNGNRPGLEKTTGITDMPPEILLEIMKLIVASGRGGAAKNPDFERFLQTCRVIYIAGLPLLFREVTIDKLNGAAKIKALESGPTKMDKTSYVRTLKIPAGLVWNVGTRKVLAKCLQNVTSFEFACHGPKVMAEIWKLLLDAPVLKELRLDLHKEAFDAFDENTAFPDSVRVLIPELKESPKHPYQNFVSMLEHRARFLVDARLDQYRWFSMVKKHGPLPNITKKILRFAIGPSALSSTPSSVPSSVTDLTIEGHTWYGYGSQSPTTWPLGHLDSVVDLKLCDIDTRDLLKLSGSPPTSQSLS